MGSWIENKENSFFINELLPSSTQTRLNQLSTVQKNPPQPSSLFYLATGSLTGITCSNTSVYTTVPCDDSPTFLQKSKAKIPSEHIKGYNLYIVIPPSNNSTLLPEHCLISYLIKDVLPSTKWKTRTLSNEQALGILSSKYALSNLIMSTKQCNCDKMVFVSGKREGKEF